MRSLPLALLLLLPSCASESLPQRLEDACEARVCPVDPPEAIGCMPIVPLEWQRVCSTSCREFLSQSCHILFLL